jgi:ribose transport system permease protein
LNGSRKFARFVGDQKLLFVIVLLVLVLSLADRSFFSFRSLTSIIDHITINGIMAAGMTVLLISGAFDLSVGAVLAFTGVVTFLLQPYGLWISVVGGLLSGTAIGALNGLLVVKGRINAFIVTLGSMIIFRGFGLGLTSSTPVKGRIEAFTHLGQGSILGVSNPVWILIVTYVVVWYVLKYTKFGRDDYAIGGNPLSARLTGIFVDTNRFFYFVFTSFTAAVAGLIYCSRVNTASAVFAPGIELFVIAAAVLGGTSLFGGKGGIIGTILGVVILGIVERAMVVFNVDTNFQLLVRGLVILGVVVADTLVTRRQERRSEKEVVKHASM